MLNTRLTIALIFCSSICFSQHAQEGKEYPDRYRLDIPDQWKKKPKLVSAITELLSKTVDILKDKDFCLKGRTPYCVHLYIDSFTVNNEQKTIPDMVNGKYSASGSYSFYASLRVFDSLENPLTDLRIVSTDENFFVRKDYQAQKENVIYESRPVYDTTGRVVGKTFHEVPGSPFNEPLSNSSIFSEEQLIDVCEGNLLKLRKLLKKLN